MCALLAKTPVIAILVLGEYTKDLGVHVLISLILYKEFKVLIL